MKMCNCSLIKPIYSKDTDSVAEVASKMKSKGVRGVYVIDKANKPIGYISAVDVVNKVVATKKNPAKIKAKDIMNVKLGTVQDDEDPGIAYLYMVRSNTFSCPVVDGKGKFLGVITLQEAARHVVSHAKK